MSSVNGQLQMTKLGEIFKYQPKSKIKAGEGLKDGVYKFFTSSNLQTKYLNEYIYDKPSLIFGTGGSASIHFCNGKFSTSTDCLVVSSEKDIDLNFIYLYLRGNIQILENGFKGAGLKHMLICQKRIKYSMRKPLQMKMVIFQTQLTEQP